MMLEVCEAGTALLAVRRNAEAIGDRNDCILSDV